MKINKIDIENESYDLYINEIILSKYDIKKKDDLEKILKKVFIFLKRNQKIMLKGFYEVDIYMNKKIGAYLEIYKIDNFYYTKDIDLKVKIITNSKFYLKINDIDLFNKENILCYDDNYYIDIDLMNNDIINYIEFGEIVNDKEAMIEDCAISINNIKKI